MPYLHVKQLRSPEARAPPAHVDTIVPHSARARVVTCVCGYVVGKVAFFTQSCSLLQAKVSRRGNSVNGLFAKARCEGFPLDRLLWLST